MLRWDIRLGMAIAVMVLGMAAAASGQRLLEVDGIELRGEAQLVMSGGGTCNVLESDTAYDEKKENHGAPMDVWRLDFSVRNGSGRWLDHLIARFQIESEWPDCTNWDGPEAGEFPQNIEWADSIGHIQESGRNMVAPDQTLTETRLLIVLRGDPEPRFANWSLDFDFAAAQPPADSQSGASGSPAATPAVQQATASASGQLPPDIQADRYLRQAEQAVRDGDAATALAAMERLEALQQDYGLEPPPEDHYRYAQAWEAAGAPERAMAAAVRYLQLQGRDAEHYIEALDLMNRAETGEAAVVAADAGVRTEPAQLFRPGPEEPSCTGQADSPSCWTELVSHPGCYVFLVELSWAPELTTTWSAGCTDGLANGSGTLTVVEGDYQVDVTGLRRDGKPVGHSVVSSNNGFVFEGPYVDARRHGRWFFRHPKGTVGEGQYVEGEKQGYWREIARSGGVNEGLYVEGERHGDWALRFASGRVNEGPYVEGERHGDWALRFASGRVNEGPYVEGKKHGDWVERNADGSGWEGLYVEGKKHGDWVFRDADGNVTSRQTWRNGELVNQ